MDTHEPTSPHPPAAEPESEEEFRTLLLRLLRLVAAEVAELLRRRNDAAPSPGDSPRATDGAGDR